MQITHERDTALCVSENRRRAWEMHRVQSLERENYLQDQSGYAEYCKSYSEGFSFHPEFVAAHPEYAK